MSDISFYKALITNSMPIKDLLKRKECFIVVPDDWCIVVVDVEQLKKEVSKDSHNDVNLVTTGSIITVLNTIKSIDKQIQIPYFFRGSSATFILPKTILVSVMSALETYKSHVLKNLDIILEYGSIAVSELYEMKATIKIAKLRLNGFLVIPVILGNGLKVAERLIRSRFKDRNDLLESEPLIDLQGMECRWDEIEPNLEEKKVICLLVVCNKEREQAEIFTKILSEIDYIFGDLNARTPITTAKLKLDNSFKKMRKEMYARLGKSDRWYFVQNWLITYFGSFYFKFFKGGKAYLYRVTQLSDTMVLDGSINTIFSGTERDINKLKLFLDTLEADGDIFYGMHATHASIMSCYIEDREENHIHFVDGTEGGYQRATIQLRKKFDGSF